MRCTPRHTSYTRTSVEMDAQPLRAGGGREINRACMTGAQLYQQDPGVELGVLGLRLRFLPLCLGPRKAKPCPSSRSFRMVKEQVPDPHISHTHSHSLPILAPTPPKT